MTRAGGRRVKKKKNEGLVICWHSLDDDDSILFPLIDPDFWLNRGNSLASLQGFNSPGEKGLLAAIVYRAFLDLTIGTSRDRTSAIEFFTATTTVVDSYVDYCFNFDFLCEALELPKDKILRTLASSGKLSDLSDQSLAG